MDIRNLPPRDHAAQRLGLVANLNTLVITGASLGAQSVNEAVVSMLGKVKVQGWQILHLSGREHAMSVRSGYREIGVAAHVIDFTPAMRDLAARTTLVALLYQSTHDASQSCEEHAAIVAALERGDSQQAEALMRAHIGNVQGALHESSSTTTDELARLRASLTPLRLAKP